MVSAVRFRPRAPLREPDARKPARRALEQLLPGSRNLSVRSPRWAPARSGRTPIPTARRSSTRSGRRASRIPRSSSCRGSVCRDCGLQYCGIRSTGRLRREAGLKEGYFHPLRARGRKRSRRRPRRAAAHRRSGWYRPPAREANSGKCSWARGDEDMGDVAGVGEAQCHRYFVISSVSAPPGTAAAVIAHRPSQVKQRHPALRLPPSRARGRCSFPAQQGAGEGIGSQAANRA